MIHSSTEQDDKGVSYPLSLILEEAFKKPQRMPETTEYQISNTRCSFLYTDFLDKAEYQNEA